MESRKTGESSGETIASTLSFLELCQLFEKIITCKVKKKRYELLCNYISNYRESWKSIDRRKSKLDGNTFFPVLRLILPTLDRARGPYGVKEHTLARIYVRILCLPKDGPDAEKLLNYRVPKFAGKVAGDFAEVAYWVLKSRCPKTSHNVSVEEVNIHLDNIARYHANHEPRLIDKELTEMLRTLCAVEQKWMIRIILKEIRLHIGHKGIFNSFHYDACALYDVCNDLQKVCQTLMDPTVKLYELGVEVFSHIRPMLSERTDPVKVSSSFLQMSEKMTKLEKPGGSANNYLILETKLDGERFQLHILDKEFKYFSHNGFDYTQNFGKDQLCPGTLTSLLAPLIDSEVKSIILDGEMMVWDHKFHLFKTKGHCMDVKKLKCSAVSDDGTVLNWRYQPCFCAFDILYYNGQVLTGRPLIERVKLLKSVFKCQEGVLAHSPVTKEVTTREEIVEALNIAIDCREEGIILKEPFSTYKPNDRKGGWYKIKPEYIGEVSDTLDLLIIGGYYGEGRRGKGIISHFLLGVAVPPSSAGVEPNEFHSVGRVGSGYSFDELEELLSKLAPFWKEVKLNNMEHENYGVQWSKERPDVWIAPQRSCVLQIKATEIARSDAFRTGYTLRFPRVESVRYDKNWSDCMTTTEMTQLRELACGKLYHRHMKDDDISPRKRQKLSKCPVASLGEQFKGINTSDIEKISGNLSGKEICVLNGNEEYSKHHLETLVVQHDGSITQNPGPKTFCVVVGNEMPVKVKNIIQAGAHDVTRISWLLRVCNGDRDGKNSQHLTPRPEDMLAVSKETSKSMAKYFDKYGDSYTDPITLSRLCQILDQIPEEESKITQEMMVDLDTELFSGPSPFSIFHLCHGYFTNSQDTYTCLEDCHAESFFIGISNFIIHSGTVSSEIDQSVSHVVVESSSSPNIRELMKINSMRKKKFHLVTLDWIRCSCEKNIRLKELDFHPTNPVLKEIELSK